MRGKTGRMCRLPRAGKLRERSCFLKLPLISRRSRLPRLPDAGSGHAAGLALLPGSDTILRISVRDIPVQYAAGAGAVTNTGLPFPGLSHPGAMSLCRGRPGSGPLSRGIREGSVPTCPVLLNRSTECTGHRRNARWFFHTSGRSPDPFPWCGNSRRG